MVFIYITCKDVREAKKISLHLLKKRLIACSNLFPIQSMYWWNNKIENSNEYALFAKTTKKQFNKIIDQVQKIHSYDVPCICLIDSKGNKLFERWVNKETIS